MDELLQLSLRELYGQITAGRVSCRDLTRTYLDRIDKVNPQINAVVRLEADMAMKQAERNDIALKSGESPGRLFGIPMTIKDSLNTYDMVTTWGTSGRESFRPGKDASCVARLRNEGAVLMGKTNTPEFTLAFKSSNSLFGRTSNPHDLTRTLHRQRASQHGVDCAADTAGSHGKTSGRPGLSSGHYERTRQPRSSMCSGTLVRACRC